jgi:hypothetical protein
MGRMQKHAKRPTRLVALAARAVAALALLAGATDARAFALVVERIVFSGPGVDVPATLAQASRWSSISGLGDGLQVGVAPGFAAALGAASPAEEALVNQAVANAFAAWESPVLHLDVSFESAGVAEGASAGLEIDLFAVPGTHPVFAGTDYFGRTFFDEFFATDRPLSNGQSTAGYAIDGADVYINIDNTAALAVLLGFTQEEQLLSLQRLVMHEVGHALGLGHPNADNPFGARTNFDSDGDPLNAMPIDPADPFAGLQVSSNTDGAAILSNRPCGEPLTEACPALFFTSLRNDDLGGRDVLYPNPAPPAIPALPAPGAALLAVLLSAAAAGRLRGRAGVAA